MILISVAHSAGSGAYNSKYELQEYNCSQVMSRSCYNSLKSSGIDCFVYDVGKIEHQKDRIKMKLLKIKELTPKLSIEIHLNSYGTKVGTEEENKEENKEKNINYSSVFYDENKYKAKNVAKLISENFKKGFESKNFSSHKCIGLPCDGFDIERFWFVTRPVTESLIIEPCFISNNEQAKLLTQESYLNAIGFMVADGVKKWLNI